MLVYDFLRRGKNDDDAVYSQLGALTYLGLRVAAENCRRRLYGLGVRRGHRVAVYSRNRAEYIAAYMAIAALGAIVVPINCQFSMRETALILQDAGCRLLIAEAPLALAPAISAVGYETVRQVDMEVCIEPTKLAPPPPLPKDFGADEPCAIVYKADASGSFKGVVLSHRNLVMNAIDMQQTLRLKRSDNVLCVLPMHHCMTWICAVLGALYVGATISVLDTFTPRKTIDVTRALGVTVIVMVPTVLALLTRLAAPADMQTLRFVLLGGANLPPAVGAAFEKKFAVPVVEGYALTEAAAVVTLNPPDAPRLGSVGRVIEDVRIRLLKEDGSEAGPGEAGELLVQGPNVMHGYWRRPEATAAALSGGWLHTGDMARRDADGYLHIVGHREERIVSLGENIYPREIESLVYLYPGIMETAVVAVADALRGEAGCCFYTVHADAVVDPQALKQHLQRNLAMFKVPRDFVEIEKMPRTAAGRIDRQGLSALKPKDK